MLDGDEVGVFEGRALGEDVGLAVEGRDVGANEGLVVVGTAVDGLALG